MLVLPKTRQEAIRWYANALSKCTTNELAKETRRQLAKNDLFYLLVFGLKRSDANRDWLFDRCRQVQESPNGHLDLWARGHYKSTIITFALTIQDILNDPDVTFGMFAHTRNISAAFLKQIKREFEINEELKADFDDILWSEPQKQAQQWSEQGGIIVKRNGNPKEATIEAWGLVDSQPTSKHFRRRVYDDVVTVESVSTADQIEKTTSAWEMSLNLGGGENIERYIGTRYSLHDTYATMISRNAVSERLFPATSNGRMDGKPVFFSEHEWETIKKKSSRKSIASQQLQNPLADEDARFQPLWLTSYEVRPAILNIGIMGDPSLGRGKDSDNTAIVVIGYAKGGVKYLLDGACHRMSLSQRWETLRNLYVKWMREPGIGTISVGWERYGLQSDREYFEERMRVDKPMINFAIEELNWSNNSGQSKEARIDRLEPDFRNRRLLLPNAVWHDGRAQTWRIEDDPESKQYQAIVYSEFRGLTKKQQQFLDAGSFDLVAKALKKKDNEKQIYDLTVRLMQEYLQFPFGAHDDLLDATSRVYDMNLVEPMTYERRNLDPPVFHDS